MADTFKEINELRVRVTLQNGTAETTRTLTVNNPKTYSAQLQQQMKTFRDKLMTGSLSGVIQPANWRDNDDISTPYTTTNVEFSTFTSTEVFHDLDE